MFVIQHSFAEEKEGYITVPAMKRFVSYESALNVRSGSSREDYIKAIQNFATYNDNNKEKVLNWVDVTIKEGIKELQLCYIQKNNKNKESIIEILENEIYDTDNRHGSNHYAQELRVFKVELTSNAIGEVISIMLGQTICVYDKKTESARYVSYPICIELYLEELIIIARAKSKSNMYTINGDLIDFNINSAVSTNVESLIKKSCVYIAEIIGLEIKKDYDTPVQMKNQLYKLLNKYTGTPIKIQEKLQMEEPKIEGICKCIAEEICGVSRRYEVDIIGDITNTIEKYLSITEPDKTIFTENRDAYPIRLLATDQEFSRVDQKSSEEQPLQSKSIFFDNKKMLQNSESCDGIFLKFKRTNCKYFRDQYPVRISVVKNSCNFKFTTYTEEEDIINVLFSFITA